MSRLPLVPSPPLPVISWARPPDLNEPPHSWVVIEPQFTNSRNIEVLVATAETVLVVDANDAQDQVRIGPARNSIPLRMPSKKKKKKKSAPANTDTARHVGRRCAPAPLRLQRFDKGPVTSMSVSPNGRLLALFTAEGILQVISTDFQKNFSVFATKTRAALNQLVWCGVDSVVLHWDKLLLMVGPNGDYIEYAQDVRTDAHMCVDH